MNITAITVNYNTPKLLNQMLSSFRKFYDVPVLIIDGSEKPIDYDYDNIIHFKLGYNIHHGAGLTYGIERVATERVLFIDSDVVFHKHGFLEDLDSKLRKDSYGIGDVQIVDEKGFNKPTGIKYLHPAFCLINMDMVFKFPMPIVHGAPMIETMKAIHQVEVLNYLGKLNAEEMGLSGNNEILQHEQWVTNDFRNKNKKYLTHDWQGTVKKFGYNL